MPEWLKKSLKLAADNERRLHVDTLDEWTLIGGI